jgi:hypothetical protein
MKRTLLAASLLLALSTPALAKAPDSYQVTGPVVEVTADVIVVMKGTERFEIGRDPADKTEVKVGDKVTIKYRMTATSIEKKDAKAAAPAAKKGK